MPAVAWSQECQEQQECLHCCPRQSEWGVSPEFIVKATVCKKPTRQTTENVTFQMCANEVYRLFHCREWETFKLLPGEVLVWIWVLPHESRSAGVSCANVPSLLSLGRNLEGFEVLLIFRRTSAANGLCEHAKNCEVTALLSWACSVPLGFQDPLIQVQRQASCKKCTLVPTADNLVLVKSGVKCHTGSLTMVFDSLMKYGTQCCKDFNEKVSGQKLQALHCTTQGLFCNCI